ncbi:MAG: universal stress protein [Planctomycetota bacterium]
MSSKSESNHVLCAIDVNDYDPQVVELAAEFAVQLGAQLDLLHVSDAPDPNTAAWPAYLGAPNVVAEDHAILDMIDCQVEGMMLRKHHLIGNPTQKILGFAERNPPVLLVMGTHGRQGLQRIFGSVASRVLRRAECPVVVLRQRKKKNDEPSDSRTETQGHPIS